MKRYNLTWEETYKFSIVVEAKNRIDAILKLNTDEVMNNAEQLTSDFEPQKIKVQRIVYQGGKNE